MRFERLKERVRNLGEVSSWPQMLGLVERATHREDVSVWDLPVAACLAMGGDEETALPAAAAVFCSVASIHLVDDMLDDDPRGDYHVLGNGPTANLSLAFQAAGHLSLDEPSAPPEVRAALQASFARMSLATCFGQNLDSHEVRGEEDYWRVVGAKTPPLFAEALRMGALLGGATAETADLLARLGAALGRYVQVSDDMADALETPARADWMRRANNLPMLYAMTAGHPEREEFVRLAANADDPEALAEAQKILFRSGAVSYCTLKLLEISREVQALLSRIALPDPGPVRKIVEVHMKPLNRLLESVGVENPSALPLH
jgi:geranylgeranyl pyrophosphate synthase